MQYKLKIQVTSTDRCLSGVHFHYFSQKGKEADWLVYQVDHVGLVAFLFLFSFFF